MYFSTGAHLVKNFYFLNMQTTIFIDFLFNFFVPIIRYPDDSFDRYWEPLPDRKHSVSSTHNVTSADFWNLPPPDVLNTAFVAEQDAPLVLQWPPMALQNDSYYVALYFADTLAENSRTFDVYINDYLFHKGLNVTSSGVSVFATQWILSGLTRVILTPASPSLLPPLINAGEVFGLFPLGRLTHTRDGISVATFIFFTSLFY
jgi:hypothetical protein